MHPLELFKYCPRCGSSRFGIHNGKSKQCASCGFTYYFNPSSATAAFIVNAQNELLVCRRGKEPAKGTFDLPGGFLDMYETGEEGVAREVKEETGLDVQESRYLFSIPNLYDYSGFTVHTLDMFFLCRVRNAGYVVAQDDVAETFWVSLARVHPDEFGLASVREAVRRFLLGKYGLSVPASGGNL